MIFVPDRAAAVKAAHRHSLKLLVLAYSVGSYLTLIILALHGAFADPETFVNPLALGITLGILAFAPLTLPIGLGCLFALGMRLDLAACFVLGCWVVSVAALFAIIRARFGSVVVVRGYCVCGYDLTANTSGVCPECGEAVDGDHAL